MSPLQASMRLKPRQRTRNGMDDLASDEGREHPPLQARFVKGRVLAQGRQMSWIDDPRLVRVEDDEIGTAPRARLAAGKRKAAAGPLDKAAKRRGKAISPEWTRRKAAASIVSRPIAPSANSAKGWRFVSTSCGS